VVLNSAKTDPRLVVDDNGTMWIIWTDITRTIVNSSNICKYVTLEYKKVFVSCFFNNNFVGLGGHRDAFANMTDVGAYNKLMLAINSGRTL
jgi:hypothetical protein